MRQRGAERRRRGHESDAGNVPRRSEMMKVEMHGAMQTTAAHRHTETHRWLLVRVLVLFLQANGACSDVVNLLRGGMFVDPSIKFALYPFRDVLAHGSKSLLPYWTCVHGGVQLWDARVYLPAPSDSACTFLLHMNSRVGGGHVVSAPLHNPRANAEYLVSLSVACNPHGGPRNQSLMALVYDDAGKEIAPRPDVIVVETDPASSVQNLTWHRRSFGMLGTGRPMYLYLASLVKGYYGLLVANVRVTLVNLVENGSFETLSLNANDLFSNVTHDVVLDAPRLKSIPSWVVESGKIRLSITGKSFQAATDGSHCMIEMNAAGVAGEISTTFAVPMNSTSKEFVLLFDAAVNPIQILPQTDNTSTATANVLVGKVGVKVVGEQTGKELLNKAYERNGTGYTSVSVGWTTESFTFKMGEDKKAKVSLRSLTEGLDYGAFVDNVAVYEFQEKEEWIKVNAPAKSCGVIIHAVGDVVESLALQLLIVLLLLVSKQ